MNSSAKGCCAAALFGLWSLHARALAPAELGVLYRAGDERSEQVARDYAHVRHVPAANLVGLDVPREAAISPATLDALRATAFQRLPRTIRALLLVWTTPYAAGCMSITTAFAAGYQGEFCEPGCGRTTLSPLYDADSLEPGIRVGWRPAMLFPDDDPAAAHALAARGRRADGTSPPGTFYLVETGDRARNVRALGFDDVERAYGGRVSVRRIGDTQPSPIVDVMAYFTGAARVVEIDRLRFRPGAVADHLTSIGGVLDQRLQTTALEWLYAGATASYGTVTEPCNVTGKFPSPMIFIGHYLRGESILEAYWKAVAMPGQGLFVGEPLAAPYARSGAAGRGQRSATESESGGSWAP